MTVAFWILIGIVFYSYLGYTLILLFFSLFRKNRKKYAVSLFEPEVTLFIAAYNEKDIIRQKVTNSLNLKYPQDKITHLWVTDGSTDGTPYLLQEYENVKILHESERKGKIGAINRGMQYVKTPLVIFSDANSMLSENAIGEIVNLFKDPTIGCVAGEKRVLKQKTDKAVSSGEGFYWQYESYIKKIESDFNAVIGAAGEIFAIRTELFQPVEPDTILDDFVISLRIAQKGFKIKYAPKAIAEECSSSEISEEMKRKVRIAAGCIQTLRRFKDLLNPFKYGTFSFQYISHKVLRWTVIPFCFPLIFLLNIGLFYSYTPEIPVYKFTMQLQIVFYLFALIGLLMRDREVRFKFLFVPYYVVMMNVAIIKGIYRQLLKKQSVNWEKAKRNM